MRDEILQLLREKPKSKKEVAAILGKRERVRTIMNELESEGYIQQALTYDRRKTKYEVVV